jgi:integrase
MKGHFRWRRVDQGTPFKVAQAQLGHSGSAATLKVYTHASLIAQREAVSLLQGRLFPSAPQNVVENRSTAEVASPAN